jgi:hypothetical protein
MFQIFALQVALAVVFFALETQGMTPWKPPLRAMENHHNHWIGLREHLQEKAPYFMGKSMVSGRFSLKPMTQS